MEGFLINAGPFSQNYHLFSLYDINASLHAHNFAPINFKKHSR